MRLTLGLSHLILNPSGASSASRLLRFGGGEVSYSLIFSVMFTILAIYELRVFRL